MTQIPTRSDIVLHPIHPGVQHQLGVVLLLLHLHEHLVRGAGVVQEGQVGVQIAEEHLNMA